ncbi:hypothetical protein HZS_4148 [Henneguya salminicola]|nr:hypothetical protein HZS_4148 [Henneguya salminicola]
MHQLSSIKDITTYYFHNTTNRNGIGKQITKIFSDNLCSKESNFKITTLLFNIFHTNMPSDVGRTK